MRRDMDLCREILRQIGDSPSIDAPVKVAVDGRSEDEITYHLHIMRQAELVEAIDRSTLDGMAYVPLRLTWRGQDFLDAARDDTVWRRAVARFANVGGSLTFELVLAACRAEIADLTGLDL